MRKPRGGGNSGYYNGVDLTVRHKNEIQTSYKGNAWAWINDRVQKQNYEGIFVGDYIPVTLTETQDGCGTNVHHMRIMGINTYTGSNTHQSGNGVLKGHIDFCARECYGVNSRMWYWGNSNNGTKQEPHPYMNSDLKTYLTTTVYNALPSELKLVISDTYKMLEYRYSESGKITNSIDSQDVKNVGKVWAPTEYEVFGFAVYGTKAVSEGLSVQYPLFRNSIGRIMYRYDSDGRHTLDTTNWWTASVCGNSSEDCTSTNIDGAAFKECANDEDAAPLCFRIAQA